MAETTFDQMGYMLGKLDTMRDTQVQTAQRDSDLLQRILTALETRQTATTTATKPPRGKLFSRVRNMPPFWQSCAAGGLFWILGICTRAYLNRGGDPMALIELLVKSVL